jgi:2-phospho-L-lactate guanylyltransferase (CobY/MobA/RfbA family)
MLFARAPRAEALAKHVAQAEPLFALALRRVSHAARMLEGVDLLVVCPAAETGAPADPGAAGRQSDEIRLAQRGGGFRERLENAFADARSLGYGEIVAVPGDVPGLSAAHLEAAFAALRQQPTVFGPSPDGGVYLIGTREPVGGLFAGVRWRTRHVLGDLVESAGGGELLPALADVDGERDLGRFERDRDPAVRAILRAIRRPVLPRRPGPGRRPRARLLASPDAQRGPPALP